MFESVTRTPTGEVVATRDDRRIVSQRHFADCSLLVTTRATPEQAYAIVRRHFPKRAEPRPLRFHVDLEPFGFFVLNGRVVPSAGGSNVYVCVAIRLLHAVALCLLCWICDGAPWTLTIAAFAVVIGIVKYRAARIARTLAAELPTTAPR